MNKSQQQGGKLHSRAELRDLTRNFVLTLYHLREEPVASILDFLTDPFCDKK